MNTEQRESWWKWFEFSLLEEAKKYEDLPTWSVDFLCPFDNKVKKRFISSGYLCFWTSYMALNTNDKHYYEVIRDTAPCRLFLDVESTTDAPGECFDKIIKTIIKVAKSSLKKEKFGKIQNIILLDSSDASKASCHIIFDIRNNAKIDGKHKSIYFKNISECGIFVKEIFKEFLQVDKLVYTKNRSFRIIDSSKLGSKRILKWRKIANYYYPDNLSYESFLMTLVQYIQPDGVIFPMLNVTEKISIQPSCQEQLQNIQSPILIDIIADIITIIESEWNDGNVSFSSYDNLTKEIFFNSTSRWCEQKKDYHKSNHIYFLANLTRLVWWQGCHDREAPCIDIETKHTLWSHPRFFPLELQKKIQQFIKSC